MEVLVQDFKTTPPTRRRLLGGAAALAIAALSPLRADAQDQSSFEAVLQSLKREALASGVTAAVFDQSTAGLTPDPAVLARAASQPEFDTPIWDYVRRAAGGARAARGRSAAAQWAGPLAPIARRSGVPPEIAVAAWGMEADFARPAQTSDVLRSLATLAFAKPQDPTFRTEFVNALKMLQTGAADRQRLRGSWAGAMGMPQFMPSAYLRYAVSFAGSGPADIWNSPPDALASIANFFQRSGWERTLPWGFEVAIPADFAWSSLSGSFADWSRLGLKRVGNQQMPAKGKADLFAPAGAAGPSFLLCANYWVIKQYDNSDSYALALGLLADAIAGRPGPRKAWPKNIALLPREDRARLQRKLAALRIYDGAADGKVGPATREAIHRYEISARIHPADGFASAAVLAALDGGASRR